MAEQGRYALDRMTLSEHLAQQVIDFIRREDLPPGSRLPSLKTLSERFSVATPTLREALHRLEAMGIVETRHGSGIYTRAGIQRMMLSNPYYGDLDVAAILDLLDARLLIEPELAELAAKRVTQAELEALEEHLRQAGRHLVGGEQSDRALQQINMQFHSRIAALSGNAVLHQVVASLLDLHSKEQMVVLYLFDDRSRDHQEHKAIFAALRRRDPRTAKQLMRQHLLDVKSVIQSRLLGGEAPT